MRPSESKPPTKQVRAAVYCRVSTDERLGQDFNSLDAQRECCESFIAARKLEGWTCLPTKYDDGGFSGGNVERPALQRLLADLDAGRLDLIVAYKFDRLSRSIKDFALLLERFEEKGVVFVSVTQPIDTSTAAGRLLQNVLITFSAFEREMISERTKDKIRMTKMRGKWCGGTPPLGYDRAEKGGALVVNEPEAQRVREIFQMYLKERSLLRVAQVLNARGWRSKTWTTRKGNQHEGHEFTKTMLQQLLRNPVFIGRIAHRGESFKGEHAAIVEERIWKPVQKLLTSGAVDVASHGPNPTAYMLKGLVHCAACGSTMTAGTTSGRAARYRYYVCTKAKKQGVLACPTRSVPAPELEAFVVDRLHVLGRDPKLVAGIIERAKNAALEGVPTLKAEDRTLAVEVQKLKNEAARLVAALAGPGDGSATATGKLAEVERQVEQLRARQAEIKTEIAALSKALVNEADARAALELFDPVWQHLALEEKTRLVRAVVERVEFDGRAGEIEIRFHPLGLASLAEELKAAPEPVVAPKGATA